MTLFHRRQARGHSKLMVYHLQHPQIDGRVKLKSGHVSKITGNAVVMEDGTELEAGLIVYARGTGP